MLRLSFLVSTLLAMASVHGVNGSISLDPTLSCQTQTIKGEDQEVCATYTAYGPSPAMYPNGTVVYVGPTGYDFTYYRDLEDGTDTSKLKKQELHQHSLNFDVSVSWEKGACQVKIAQMACNSCSICSGESETTLSSDCTNIPGGREVTCEKAMIYYPLKKFKRYKRISKLQEDLANAGKRQ